MPPRRPLSLAYTGKPGRPAVVRNIAKNAMREALTYELHASVLVPRVATADKIASEARRISEVLIEALEKADIRLMPGSVAREIALFVGEPAPADSSVAPVVGTTEATNNATDLQASE